MTLESALVTAVVVLAATVGTLCGVIAYLYKSHKKDMERFMSEYLSYRDRTEKKSHSIMQQYSDDVRELSKAIKEHG